MLTNNFKVAIRKLFKQKILSFVTILGLAVSLSVCLVVILFIRNELSYDSFQSRADRIALFQQTEKGAGSGSGFSKLLSNLSQVEQSTRIIKTKALLYNGSKSFSSYENNFCFADSNFLKVFDLNFLQGNAATAFQNPDGILISEKIALKYFSNKNPIGQSLLFNDKKIFYVTGVFKNLPSNSHINIDLIANFKSASSLTGQNLDGYWDYMSLTYMLLSTSSKFSDISAQLPQILKQTNDPNSKIWKLAIIPLREIYLKAKIDDDRVKAPAAINEVYIFSVISLLIILLAAFNYVNITTAKAISYLKEVGVRKIIGATKRQLIQQFLTESLLNVLIAATLALIGAWFGIIYFNHITGAALQKSLLFSTSTITVYFAAVIAFALINGIYPALILSSFKPIDSIKKIILASSRHHLQKVLVTFQFTITIAILVALFIVSKQLYFIHNQDLGYNRKQILTLDIPVGTKPETKQTFLTQLQSISFVESVTSSTPLPGQGSMHNKLVEDYVPKSNDLSYSYIMADKNFLSVFDISLLQGENYSSKDKPEQHNFLINQSMSKYLELGKNAVGKPLAYYNYQYNADGTYKEVPVVGRIKGVIEDYHQNNLRSAIEPMLIQLDEGWNTKIAIKLKSDDAKGIVVAVQRKWQQFFPGKPFEYSFMDDQFNDTYKSDIITEHALTIFAALAMFISCLGLFGLTTIIAQTRIKEIGIRKVLGASIASIVQLLSKDFLQLVAVATVIATPIAWWFMNHWLQNYSFRINISWWMFIAAGLIALLIALITISFQAIKAAIANPVKSLRTE